MSKESNNHSPLDILIATNNRFKIDEMGWFLEGIPNLKIHSLDELSEVPDVEEDGETLEQNSNKKALEISRLTDWLVFTSDAGVQINGLREKWDYRRPKRILGENATDTERIVRLMELMKYLKGNERRAEYILALSLASKGNILWSKEFDSYPGIIVKDPNLEDVGLNRAMGRMWYLPEFDKNEDQLSDEERNQLRIKYQSEVKGELVDFMNKLVQSNRSAL